MPQAAQQLADGNLGFQLGAPGQATQESPGADDSADAGDTGSGDALSSAPEQSGAATALVAGRAAQDWLAGMQRALAGDQLLALPYGDLDVMAALRAGGRPPTC
ncbi:MAG: hypothetical protein R2731_08305 [Nocardioides sp.]